jgi:hypothetical protein
MVARSDMPPHARAGQRHGRGHRFAAYPRCSADTGSSGQKRRSWCEQAGRRSAERSEAARARCAPHSACGTHLCKAWWGERSEPPRRPALLWSTAPLNGRRASMAASLKLRVGTVSVRVGAGFRRAGRVRPGPGGVEARRMARRGNGAVKLLPARQRRSGVPPNEGMKLTKLSATPMCARPGLLVRRCRLMPAPARMDAGTASQLIPGVRRTVLEERW